MVCCNGNMGLALIGLIITIAVPGILAAVIIPRHVDIRKDAPQSAVQAIPGGLGDAAIPVCTNRVVNAGSSPIGIAAILDQADVSGFDLSIIADNALVLIISEYRYAYHPGRAANGQPSVTAQEHPSW